MDGRIKSPYLLGGNAQLGLQASLSGAPDPDGVLLLQFTGGVERVTAASVGKTAWKTISDKLNFISAYDRAMFNSCSPLRILYHKDQKLYTLRNVLNIGVFIIPPTFYNSNKPSLRLLSHFVPCLSEKQRFNGTEREYLGSGLLNRAI